MRTISSFQGEYRFLSNFWPCHMMYEGLCYPTLEHAYQAAKVCSKFVKQEILDCETPGKAKAYLENHSMQPDFWSEEKSLEVMRKLLLIKFNGRQPFLVQALLNTEDAVLEEGNTWNDTFWGICDGEGKNHLGKLLMLVRNILRKEKESIERELRLNDYSKIKVGRKLEITQRQLYEKMISYKITKDSDDIKVARIKLEQYHHASRIIETDGFEGIQTASNFVGEDVALAILISWARRNCKSTERGYPIPKEIDDEVNNILRDEKIINF